MPGSSCQTREIVTGDRKQRLLTSDLPSSSLTKRATVDLHRSAVASSLFRCPTENEILALHSTGLGQLDAIDNPVEVDSWLTWEVGSSFLLLGHLRKLSCCQHFSQSCTF